MKKRNAMPLWKQLVMSQESWPKDLVIPQKVHPPAGTESLCSGCDVTEYWNWQILRAKDGRTYYLKVWFYDDPQAFKEGTLAVKLTPIEALNFLLIQQVPPVVAADVKRFRARRRGKGE